eukprot:scaffold7055_cov254-Pinguiococcus_pyrenoidosus.AAC.17
MSISPESFLEQSVAQWSTQTRHLKLAKLDQKRVLNELNEAAEATKGSIKEKIFDAKVRLSVADAVLLRTILHHHHNASPAEPMSP